VRSGTTLVLPRVRRGEPRAGPSARDRGARSARPYDRGAARAERGASANGDLRAPVRLQGMQRDPRRGAERRRPRISILARRDRVGSGAVGVRAGDRGVSTEAHEHGEEGRRRDGTGLGFVATLDPMRARALRCRAWRARHDARARRASRDVRRGAGPGRDGPRAHRRVLGSRVLPATLSDVDECTSASENRSTTPGSSAPSARCEIDPLHVAPIRDEKETGWI